MYRRMLAKQDSPRNGTLLSGENILLFLCGSAFLVFLVWGDHRNVSPKWLTAVGGTFVTFVGLIGVFRKWWRAWEFWVSFAICLAFHALLVWILFRHVLSGMREFPFILWFPVAFLEGLVLIIPVGWLLRKLTHTQGILKID
jgi:hypothetical protein